MSVSGSDLISLRKDFFLVFLSPWFWVWFLLFLFVCLGVLFLFFLCLSVKRYEDGQIGFMGDESCPVELR